MPQREQDGGRYALRVNGTVLSSKCRTHFRAPKYACDSFDLTTTVESGYMFDVLSEASRECGSSFCFIAVGLVLRVWITGISGSFHPRNGIDFISACRFSWDAAIDAHVFLGLSSIVGGKAKYLY